MYGGKNNICPGCGRRLVLARTGYGMVSCYFCEAELGMASSYAWSITLISYLSVAITAVFTYNPERRGAWLLFLMLMIVPFRLFWQKVTPPWFTTVNRAHRPYFLACFLGVAFVTYALTFVIEGWAYWILGASMAETQEKLEMLSLPLAWVWPQFLVTPRVSLIDVLGVILANSLFYSILILICWRFVRFVFNRNRVTRIGVTADSDIEDEV